MVAWMEVMKAVTMAETTAVSKAETMAEKRVDL